MEAKTFWTSIIIAAFIALGGVAIIGSGSDKPKESKAEGYITYSDGETITFDPVEINVPTTYLDFTDEPPMLITPNMAD